MILCGGYSHYCISHVPTDGHTTVQIWAALMELKWVVKSRTRSSSLQTEHMNLWRSGVLHYEIIL